jgi:hypothetical protein
MYRNRLVRAYLAASRPDVLNLTLNLVTSHRLAWQQRKAESFTVTPRTPATTTSDIAMPPVTAAATESRWAAAEPASSTVADTSARTGEQSRARIRKR